MLDWPSATYLGVKRFPGETQKGTVMPDLKYFALLEIFVVFSTLNLFYFRMELRFIAGENRNFSPSVY